MPAVAIQETARVFWRDQGNGPSEHGFAAVGIDGDYFADRAVGNGDYGDSPGGEGCRDWHHHRLCERGRQAAERQVDQRDRLFEGGGRSPLVVHPD